jgi:hypothetical protein
MFVRCDTAATLKRRRKAPLSHVGSAALFMSAKGSFASFGLSSTHFRSAPISRHFQYPSACLKGAKLGHDANKKASKEKAAPSAALQYRTMWCRPALFARLFTTDPTDLRSRSGSATHTQTCADRAGKSALLSRRQSTPLLVVHSAGDDPIRVAGASRGRQVRDHARRTARRRS